MINPINLSNINRISFKGGFKHKTKTTSPVYDSFEKSPEAKYKQSIEKARAEIIKTLVEEGKEKMFIISSNGRILGQATGDGEMVELEVDIEPNCIILHGHPFETSFSPIDIETFIELEDSIETIVYTKNNKTAKLKKNSPLALDKNMPNEQIAEKLKNDFLQIIIDDLGLIFSDSESQEEFYYSDFIHEYNKTARASKIKEEILKKLAKDYDMEYFSNIFEDDLTPKADFVNWAKETNFIKLLLKNSLNEYNILGEIDGYTYYNVIGNENYILKTKGQVPKDEIYEDYKIIPVLNDEECVAKIKSDNPNKIGIDVINFS